MIKSIDLKAQDVDKKFVFRGYANFVPRIGEKVLAGFEYTVEDVCFDVRSVGESGVLLTLKKIDDKRTTVTLTKDDISMINTALYCAKVECQLSENSIAELKEKLGIHDPCDNCGHNSCDDCEVDWENEHY